MTYEEVIVLAKSQGKRVIGENSDETNVVIITPLSLKHSTTGAEVRISQVYKPGRFRANTAVASNVGLGTDGRFSLDELEPL